MAKPQTKADLEREIADMRAAPSPDDRLVAALAGLIASPHAPSIKHIFFRRDGGAMLNLSIDMHEAAP